MAISVTTDLVDVSSADTTTTNGTFYRLNGTSTGNPAADADAHVQGGGCIANKMGAATGTDVGGHFNHTTTFDLSSGKHLFYWRQIITPGNMLTKANQGITLGLTNTSTTSTSAWSTTNYKKWYMDGSDTMPIAPGWLPYCLDASLNADASAGTLTLNAVKNIGFICRQNSGITTTVSNQFVDAIRAGTGVTLTTSVGTDVATLDSIFSVDNVQTNRWGVLTQSSGIFYGQGKINVGASGQSAACNFVDASQVFLWRKNIVADTFNGIFLLGASGAKTTFQLTSSVIRGQANQRWNVTTDANSDFKLYGCSVANLHTASLSAGSVLSDTSFSGCGTIEVNGAAVDGCTFSGAYATQLKVDSTAEMANITSSIFTSAGTGHAIELTAAGTYDFDGLSFTGYAGSNGSTGNEAVFVNVASGSVTINVSGGNTPSYRTAGASVTVVSGSVTVTLTVTDSAGTAIQDAAVLVAAAAGGGLPYQATVTISNSGTTATVTHTGHGMATNDKVLVKGASHYQNNGVFSITKLSDNSYSYPLSSAPGSNPTGTIKATFVVLSGVTNASGQLSMSRVFPSNQPVSGWARKSTTQPYYKTGQVTGTVLSASGANLSALLVLDQ